ncbi:MAG: hypothetical protein FWC64_05400 [Treponema sp.]|nr:hypothetical protein [Treponema sp.]
MAEVRQAEFARICGVAPSVIARKIRNNTLIRNAAGLLDTENPVNSRYAARRRLKTNAAALEENASDVDRRPVAPPVDFSRISDHEISEYAGLPQRLLGLTLRELVIKFKGLPGMQEYVRMLKDLASADERDQKVRERRLQLIEKDFAISQLIQYLETLMKQILEYPKSVTDEIIALVQAQGGAARLDVIRKLEAGLSKIIKNAKGELVKGLSGLRSKYQDSGGLDQKIKDAIADAMEDD